MAPYELVKTMRASVLVLGPARALRHARVAPGGCAIGARPVDQHLKGLRRWAPNRHRPRLHRARAKRLKGARSCLDMITVTGTENLHDGGDAGRGETILDNAAREPEVEDLATALNAMGAKIEAPALTSS